MDNTQLGIEAVQELREREALLPEVVELSNGVKDCQWRVLFSSEAKHNALNQLEDTKQVPRRPFHFERIKGLESGPDHVSALPTHDGAYRLEVLFQEVKALDVGSDLLLPDLLVGLVTVLGRVRGLGERDHLHCLNGQFGVVATYELASGVDSDFPCCLDEQVGLVVDTAIIDRRCGETIASPLEDRTRAAGGSTFGGGRFVIVVVVLVFSSSTARSSGT